MIAAFSLCGVGRMLLEFWAKYYTLRNLLLSFKFAFCAADRGTSSLCNLFPVHTFLFKGEKKFREMTVKSFDLLDIWYVSLKKFTFKNV